MKNIFAISEYETLFLTIAQACVTVKSQSKKVKSNYVKFDTVWFKSDNTVNLIFTC